MKFKLIALSYCAFENSPPQKFSISKREKRVAYISVILKCSSIGNTVASNVPNKCFAGPNSNTRETSLNTLETLKAKIMDCFCHS